MSVQKRGVNFLFYLLILMMIISSCASGDSGSGSSSDSVSGSGSDTNPGSEAGSTATSSISYSPVPVVSSAIIALSSTEFNSADSTYSWMVAGINYNASSDNFVWSSSGLPGVYEINATVSNGINSKTFKKEMTVSSLNQWPFFRGSIQGVGSKAPINTGATVGKEKWKRPFSDGYSHLDNYVSGAAIATDGSYYVASSMKNSSNNIELSKIAADGSKVIWQLPKDDSGSEISDRITGTPVIDKDGIVYVSSIDHYLYAIKPDGSQKWRFSLGRPAWAAPTLGKDGTIYIGTNEESNTAQIFYAVNPDGSEKWHFDVSNDIRASANIGADGTIYVRVVDGSLYALNPDGIQKWRYKESIGASGASPVIAADGTIYFGTYDWPGSQNFLYAINPDGSKKWQFKVEGGIGATPIIDTDGVIYVGTWGRYVYAINPDGTQKWRIGTLEDEIQSSPALGSDGTLYVAVRNQAIVHALNTSDGSERWNHKVCSQPAASITGPLAINSSGEIIVHCNDGALYAIE